MEADAFDGNFSRCLEHLRSEKYSAATSELYPISKRSSRLGSASENDIDRFAKSICEVVAVLAEKVKNDTDAEHFRHLITDTFRILRNCCSFTPKLQKQLGDGERGTHLMQNTKSIADAVLKLFKGENMVQLLAVIIQFLYNLGVGMEDNQDMVWDHFKGKLRLWLEMAKDETGLDQERAIKILNFASAVVEVCLPRQWQKRERFVDDFDARDTLLATIQATSAFSFDFGKKVMLKVVQVPGLVERLFTVLTPAERFTVCTDVMLVINEWRKTDEKELPAPTVHSSLQFFAKTVIMARPMLKVSMLKTKLAMQIEDVQVHVKMLEVLSVASSCSEYSRLLSSVKIQRETGPNTLIAYAIDFLCDVHTEGSREHNLLSMVRDKSLVFPDHPSYLLRRDLVRLIGNLAYLNKTVQDYVREFRDRRGLPVILEQTVIDERNPFLGEWAKLALSNLVQFNEESAKYLLEMQGNPIDVTNVLRSAGLVVEREGNHIKIRQEGEQLTVNSMVDKEAVRP